MWKRRRDNPADDETQSSEYIEALRELNALTDDIVGCGLGNHRWKPIPVSESEEDGWWRCTRCRATEQNEELERKHVLDTRTWRTPTGELIFESYNREVIELLKSDPEKYFRISAEPTVR